MKLHNLIPAVSIKWLLLIAGALWTGVGLILCDIASVWLSHTTWSTAASIGIGGFAVGIIVYRFGFRQIARHNLQRIHMMKGPAWILAFQAPRSYGIMVFMIALGFGLRHSDFPKAALAGIYLTVGLGLLLGSIQYYRSFRKLNRLQSIPVEPSG